MANQEFIEMSKPKEVFTIKAKPRPKLEDLQKIEKPGNIEKKIGKKKIEKVEKVNAEKVNLSGMPETQRVSKQKESKKKSKKASDSEELEYKKESTLIITEKPQAAMKIAYALADNVPSQKKVGQVSYYEFTKDGKKVIVGCAVGHLFTLDEIGKKKWPNFDLEWIPSSNKKGSEFTKRYLDVLKQLSKRAGNFIVATDYDIEGELIGLNVIRFICGQKDAKRMKFSALTKEDINEAYSNPQPTINWGHAYAGETRHYLDWMYGINLSRALMTAIKKVGSFRIMSIGRVQGPAIAMIVKKEKEIQAFKSEPYWQVSLLVKNSSEFIVKYAKNITNKDELKAFLALKGGKGEAATEKKNEKLSPLHPFDLTTLQVEAYKLFGITPTKTLQLAQQLYLAGFISYPRTSSQKLPASINYTRILKRLPQEFSRFTKRKVPVEGSKSDSAHPSIYPTGETPDELETDSARLYNLIVKRFVSCFCEDALLENKIIKVTVDEKTFSTKGIRILENGWLNVYDYKIEERVLPDVNGLITVRGVNVEEKETQPPHRYSEASLVSELSRKNLGTKSTRAAIIETLFKRGYAADRQIRATPLGITVTDALMKNCPSILDENLTRKFEEEMDEIQNSKKGEDEQKKILNEAKKVLTEIAETFAKNEMEIGKEIIAAQSQIRQEEKEAAKITPCTKCQKGFLVIRRNKQGKQFLACNAYPECKTTFSLPPYGLIKKTDKMCECNWPILITIRKGKRPWEFCANPNCPRRQNQISSRFSQSKENQGEKAVGENEENSGSKE
ncbi:MAG: DNA topoisomerase I [Nanoarchaeota archaeon]|nr:DNA topoisomerase I [Nanoarchaeota archaeon]